MNTENIDITETSETNEDTLHFQISTGLKRVLGSELITDDEVAIFELVKNSFDAKSKNVYLYFHEDTISIIDDGTGMNYEDLNKKWLFVAYSTKREENHKQKNDDYRDQVGDHQRYAGSKGIGRFSSDRLGKKLNLQTRTVNENSGLVHSLSIDWEDFEKNDENKFSLVNVIYKKEDSFSVLDNIKLTDHGTIITINGLRKTWTRDDISRLKSGLSKLINPFGSDTDNFSIHIHAPKEIKNDLNSVFKQTEKHYSNIADIENIDNIIDVVNGKIRNFIFSTLQSKTTFIDVIIKDDKIETKLIDRGELIYWIKEINEYSKLSDAEFSCRVYFLNRAAKSTFARRMGIASIRFGSVFLFRNGFRVVPIGDEGDDWFGIDRRKQQGYARFLGTRDIIGRIDVSGSEKEFQEASSRNQGLIPTLSTIELKECFWEKCIKRLEKYVVPVSWGTKDVDTETLAFIETDPGRARVFKAVANLIGNENVELIKYSTRLIDILNERSEVFEESLINLRVIAHRTGDQNLVNRIDEATIRFTELKKSEAEARRIADEERQAKIAAEALVEHAVAEATIAKEQLGEERKRNLFLASIASLDVESIRDMHHLVTIYAADIQQQIENLMIKISRSEEIPKNTIINSLEPISLLNKKILAVAKFATKANFRVASDFIEEDLSSYISSYIDGVVKDFLNGRISIYVNTDGKDFLRKFKPIDVSIVIDNLVSNARKAKATNITFDLKVVRKDLMEISVADNGIGLSVVAMTDNHLFEKGFTTTDGSGLGLYHVRQVISDMKGTIEVEESLQGAKFLVRIPR